MPSSLRRFQDGAHLWRRTETQTEHRGAPARTIRLRAGRADSMQFVRLCAAGLGAQCKWEPREITATQRSYHSARTALRKAEGRKKARQAGGLSKQWGVSGPDKGKIRSQRRRALPLRQAGGAGSAANGRSAVPKHLRFSCALGTPSHRYCYGARRIVVQKQFGGSGAGMHRAVTAKEAGQS